jgi:hypothetical protein
VSTVDTVVISRRFNGPPDSANGGYTCGVVAGHLNGTARVRLRVPPPLEQIMSIEEVATDRLTLMRDSQLIADGRPAEIAGDVPGVVGFDQATAAAANYRWATGHPFPTCFVCGPHRHAGDGLRIFPGLVTGREVVAAPWVPDESLCDSNGTVRREIVWAALDCPSWFAALEFEANTSSALLGQLTARLVRSPKRAERCVVVAASRGRSGRQLNGTTALYTSEGELLGVSEAVWIEPKS